MFYVLTFLGFIYQVYKGFLCLRRQVKKFQKSYLNIWAWFLGMKDTRVQSTEDI